jgi:hypothetical protein
MLHTRPVWNHMGLRVAPSISTSCPLPYSCTETRSHRAIDQSDGQHMLAGRSPYCGQIQTSNKQRGQDAITKLDHRQARR